MCTSLDYLHRYSVKLHACFVSLGEYIKCRPGNMSLLCCFAEDEYSWVRSCLILFIMARPLSMASCYNITTIIMCAQVLRVQSSSGRFVIDGLTQDSSLWALQKVLEDKTTILPDRQKSIMT